MIGPVSITYGWRATFSDAELDALHHEGFGGTGTGDWWRRVNRHSLGWVCARDGDRLVGFVNVAWDGGGHAFVLETVVAVAARRHQVGTELVAVAVREARAAGCDWLHVDFEEHLRGFYLESCGFQPTAAGLIAL